MRAKGAELAVSSVGLFAITFVALAVARFIYG